MLHLVYRQGTDHTTTSDGVLKYRRSYDLGQTWEAASTLEDPAGSNDVRDPWIVYLSTGRLVIGWVNDPDDVPTRTIWTKYSDDLGQTWSTKVQVTDHGYNNAPAWTSQPIEMPDGTIIVGTFGYKDSGDTNWSSGMVTSTDHGATFGSPVIIADGQTDGRAYAEPTIRRMSTDGTLVAIYHTLSTFYRSTSTDGGATWSAAASILTAGGRPDFIEFYPGALFMFCRDNGTNNDPRYTTSWDAGATWETLAATDGASTKNSEYGAPVLLAPGILALVYGEEQSSTDSDLFLRYFYNGYGPDVLGVWRTAGLYIAGVEIDPTGASSDDVLTFDGTKFAPAAPTGGAALTIEEEDGSPTGTPGTLKFTNGTVTDNGDGSFSVAIPSPTGGTLIIEEEDGSPTGAFDTLKVPNGSLTDNGDGSASLAIAGGGGLTQAYVGTNAIGASTFQMTNRRQYFQKITLANDCLLTDIEAYTRGHAASQVTSFDVLLCDDSGGAPDLILAFGAVNVANKIYMANVANTPRWLGSPIGYWCVAGDYWIGVQCIDDGPNDLYYDASVGAGVYVTSSGDWLTDPKTSVTTTTDAYSIRANTIR